MIAPLSETEFADRMVPLGPFEPNPVVAVAVSGGADSLALALLAETWARTHGGRVVALTVDHGLRAESGAEAERVAGWMQGRGIEHHVLAWTGFKPSADLQAEARMARYRLLDGWCTERGVLHLLLAHHRADQAETVLMRLGRGSGVDGLSAMAPVVETPWGRRLRPLLDIPPARLRATLKVAGQEWIEDPSNRNPAFARVRMRAALTAEGLTEERLAATARRMARARAAFDEAVADAAARWVRIASGGYAVLAPKALERLPDELSLRLLSRLLTTVGGGAYSPRLERLERLYVALRDGAPAARTLAGCRIVPDRGGLVVCREPAKVAPPVPLVPGEPFAWDGRFAGRAPADLPPGQVLGALGAQGWRKVGAKTARLPSVPACARPTLPAVYGEDGISAVPHLGYNQVSGMADAGRWIINRPANPLTAAGCRLVWHKDGII